MVGQPDASRGGSLEHFITDLSNKVEPGPVHVSGMHLISDYQLIVGREGRKRLVLFLSSVSLFCFVSLESVVTLPSSFVVSVDEHRVSFFLYCFFELFCDESG